MALNPKFKGQILVAGEDPFSQPAIHTLELYLDYVCPFSKKMFDTIYSDQVLSTIIDKYSGRLQLIFRQQIQPWHPSSTLTHEAGVAVLRLAPECFWDFSNALFARQTEFFDVNVVNETRNATYRRLAKIAASEDVSENEVYELLKISDKPGKDGSLNSGNAVTNDLKILVKMNRLTGVHVTPTVVFNGVVENSISSSFSKEQWEEWLEKNVV